MALRFLAALHMSGSLVAALAALTAKNFSMPAGVRRLDLTTNVDTGFPDVTWDVAFDLAEDAAPYVEVGAPQTVVLPSELESGTAADKRVLRLNFTCEVGEADASARTQPMVLLLKRMKKMKKNNKKKWRKNRKRLRKKLKKMKKVHAAMLPACDEAVTLTLHVEQDQWAMVHQSYMPTPEESARSRAFAWRDPCDVQVAAQELDAVAEACGDRPTCEDIPIGYCDADRWCSPGAAPGNCSLPAAVVNTCIHPHFKEKLETNSANPSGVALLRQLFECMGVRTPVQGRPYTTRDGPLRAPAAWDGAPGDPWCAAGPASGAPILPGAWSREAGEQAAQEWLRHGQEEHASIASFARFSLDLLRFAAPPGLLTAAHAAAGDEVRHAVAAFGLAAHFQGNGGAGDDRGVGVGVGPFPNGDTVELATSLDDLAARTFEEGCRGESAAVARLALTLALVSALSPARGVLQELFEDEARHAALAWATVIWAVRQGASVPSTPQQQRMTACTPSKQSPEVPQTLAWAGRLPSTEAEEVACAVERYWVAPWAAAVAEQQPLPAVAVPAGAAAQSIAAAVEQASLRVRSSIGEDSLAIVI